MKKSILKIAALGTAALLLAGCSAGGNTAQNDSKPTEKVKIEYWHVNAETQGGKTVEELVKGFNASQDKVEVVAKFNQDMYKGLMQNLQAAASANKMPDVVQVGYAFKNSFPETFQYTAPEDLVKEVGDKANENYFKDNFLPNIMDLAKSGDKHVGIPYSISNPVLYINKDILKSAGLDENGPKTWEEVSSFAKTIKEKTGKFGFYMQEPADSWATQALMESDGAQVMTNGKASFASPEGVNAYQLYQDMVVKDQSALHIKWEEGSKSFIDGNVGMLYTTIARRKNVQDNAKFELSVVKSPAWAGKEVKLPAGGAMLAVTSQDSKKKAATWEFLKYLYSVESMAKWTVGTGYLPPRKDVATADNGLKKFFAENKLMLPAIEQMGNMVSWVAFPGTNSLQAEQKMLEMRDKILGGAPVKETMETTQADINKLLK